MEKKNKIIIFFDYIMYFCIFIGLFFFGYLLYIEIDFEITLMIIIPILLSILTIFFEKITKKLWLFLLIKIILIFSSLYLYIGLALFILITQISPHHPMKWQYPKEITVMQKHYNSLDLSFFPKRIPLNARYYESYFSYPALMATAIFYIKFSTNKSYINNVIERNLPRTVQIYSKGKTVYKKEDVFFQNFISIPEEKFDIYLLKTENNDFSYGFAVSEDNTIYFFMEYEET